MSESKRKEAIARVVDEVTRKFADEGKLVEAGFAAMMVLIFPKGPNNDPGFLELGNMLRDAYMAGAQHLFASILGVMDEDSEPTDDDMRRMSLINSELEAFVDDYAKRHGFPPPRPPPPGRKQ